MIKTKYLTMKVAYILGVHEQYLQRDFRTEDSPEKYTELLESLKKDKAATIIRSLTRLRTALMQHFQQTDREIKYALKNLSSLEFYDKKDIDFLMNCGIYIEKANYTAEKYMMDFCKLLSERIGNIDHLFNKDWERFDLIRHMIIIPKYAQQGVLKKEHARYHANINAYPYQVYIYDLPDGEGNLLFHDERFLQTLVLSHHEQYIANSNCIDADSSIKGDIYDFINRSQNTIIAVDCENSDVYKLLGLIRSLKEEMLQKVSKIILFDDIHTTLGWRLFEEYAKIPVEHIMVDRLVHRKSLVDIALAVNVTKRFYEGEADSFILCSSDSDYWPLISSLPQADFLIMYEYNLMSQAAKSALSENGYYYCSLDVFCTGNIDDFVKAVLFTAVQKELEQLPELDTHTIVEKAFMQADIEASPEEIKRFHEKYLKKLTLQLNNGKVHLVA